MILYRKAASLRVRRWAAPEPPYFCAAAVSPYAARRSAPLSVDYVALRASGAERLEVAVCDDVRDELERMRALPAPLLIDAAESAETVFRRGEEVLAFRPAAEHSTLFLTSTRGALPRRGAEGALTLIAAFPLELPLLDSIFAEASARGLQWGVAVPILYPLTTELDALQALADAAARHRASCLAALTVDVEPTARQAMARAIELDAHDDRYAMLFHSRLEPIHLATERHVAALAHERGLADWIAPPGTEAHTNWHAAALLAHTASRMFAMELDLDLAGAMTRSSRTVAELEKPIARVAEAASLSIISGLDETSAGMLTEWLESRPVTFAEFVDEQWRMKRA